MVGAHDNAVVPIASLTKMMTAYVALKNLPLALGETGPCHVVTSDDVETYQRHVPDRRVQRAGRGWRAAL